MKTRNVTIKAPCVYWRITPDWFYKYAKDYYNAAVKSEEGLSGHYSPVPYFLYCKSIELALKAFIFSKNTNATQTRVKKQLGHNLIRCVEEAQKSDPKMFSKSQKTILDEANGFYKTDVKAFEYLPPKMMLSMLRGYKDLPKLSDLKTIAEEILRKIASSFSI